jgi:hypothetical protein
MTLKSMQKYYAMLFMWILVLGTSSCASDDQEQPQEEVEESQAEEASAEEGSDQVVVQEESAAPEEESSEVAAVEEEPAEGVAIPTEVPVESTETSQASAMSGSIESAEGRVVRYARSDAGLFASASASGAAVGRLKKGNVVMVTYEGNWARLDNGQYVDGSVLSSRGIGHHRGSNPWNSSK